MNIGLRQNSYRAFGSRTKGSILRVMLLALILLAPSGYIGGASLAQAQTGSNFPSFQVEMGQYYSHPTYPELRIVIDERMILVRGVPVVRRGYRC